MRKRRIKKPPIVIQLDLQAVRDEHGLHDFFAADHRWTRYQVRELHNLFALHEDERAFAFLLLSHQPHYWLFRSNQRRFCGDFIVVDMSSPLKEGRRVFVLDLKQNTNLKVGGGGAGVQFRHAGRAVRTIARLTGELLRDAAFEKAVGDKDQLLAYLGVDREQESGARAALALQT